MSYFYLVHSDYTEFQKNHEGAGSMGKKSLKSNIDWINKKLVVNPDCPIQLILDYVCQEVGLDKNNYFDFATNKCNLLNIKAYNPSTSGLVALTPKETYYLVLIEKDENDTRSRIVPVFNSSVKEYSDFALHLKRISSMKCSSHKRLSGTTGLKSHSSKHLQRDRSDWSSSKHHYKNSNYK